jgi:hypothetical protein
MRVSGLLDFANLPQPRLSGMGGSKRQGLVEQPVDVGRIEARRAGAGPAIPERR